jgi:hypothetical protein
VLEPVAFTVRTSSVGDGTCGISSGDSQCYLNVEGINPTTAAAIPGQSALVPITLIAGS